MYNYYKCKEERFATIPSALTDIIFLTEFKTDFRLPVIIRLEQLINHIGESGGRLPARECKPNEPYFRVIAELIGASQASLSHANARETLDDAGKRLGYAVYHIPRDATRITLRELTLLQLRGDTATILGVKGKTAKKELHLRVIKPLAKVFKLDDVAEECLQAALHDPAVAEKFPKLDLPLTSAVLSDLKAGLADDGLPEEARARIRVLMKRRGMSAVTLADAVHTCPKRLKNIIGGRIRFSHQDDPHFPVWEELLGVASGSLSRPGRFGTRSFGNINAESYPAKYAGLDPALRSKLSVYFPADFASLEDEDKEDIIEQALALIANQVTPETAARRQLQLEKYILRGELPKTLAAEIAAWRGHSAAVLPAEGFTNECDPLREPTLLMRENLIRAISGFLTHESRGEAKLEPGQLSMAFLAVPPVIRQFLEFRKARNFHAFNKSFLTCGDLTVLELSRSLLRDKSGWLAQADALAVRLVPLKRVPVTSGIKAAEFDEAPVIKYATTFKKGVSSDWTLSPNDVLKADQDWSAFCAKAYDDFGSEIKSLRKRTIRSRDSHAPILPILESPEPLECFKMMINGLKSELASLEQTTLAWAEVLRDLVLVQIQSQVALRSATLLSLDWSEKGFGHLRKVDGLYHLIIPRILFKNGDGPFFRTEASLISGRPNYQDYSRTLLDVDSSVYRDIDLYLKRARPMLSKGATDALFLLGRNGKSARLTQGALQQLVKRVWIRHVLFNPLRNTGFPGVTSVAGPHAFRHILATAILKHTGRLDLAADAIHDSVDVVDAHYARYRPCHRNGLLLEAVRCGLIPTDR